MVAVKVEVDSECTCGATHTVECLPIPTHPGLVISPDFACPGHGQACPSITHSRSGAAVVYLQHVVRDRCGPEVLLEPEGLRGNPRPSGEAGSPVAALTSSGVGTCGPDDNQAQAGHLIPALTTRCGAVFDDQQVGQLIAFDPTQVTSPENRSNPQPGDPCHTLPAHGAPPAIAFGWANAAAQGDDVLIDESPPLRTKMQPAVAYPLAVRGRDGGAEIEVGEPDIYNALRAGDGGSSRSQVVFTPDAAVRRLTPRECERLMGWPDDHTRWTDTGQEIADSHRYRACGNGVVTPVAAWIGERIMEAAA